MSTPDNVMPGGGGAGVQSFPQRKAFDSNLTAAEFSLLADKGYAPLGLVLGNCVYSTGLLQSTFGNLKGSLVQGEVTAYSQLLYDARELALRRMQNEADVLRADGVVAVRWEVSPLFNNPQWIEVTAVGTAIKFVGLPPEASRTSNARIVLSLGENVSKMGSKTGQVGRQKRGTQMPDVSVVDAAGRKGGVGEAVETVNGVAEVAKAIFELFR